MNGTGAGLPVRLRGWALPIAAGMLLAGFWLWSGSITTVAGASMDPGLNQGDRLLSSRLGTLRRGEVVVLKQPAGNQTRWLVKRLIALPGDEVGLSGDIVWVNGYQLSEPYVPAVTGGDVAQVIRQSYRLGPDQYLVLGDNRRQSTDSRSFGPVSGRAIVGHAWLRLPAGGGLQVIGWPV